MVVGVMIQMWIGYLKFARRRARYGQGLAEYGAIGALITVASIGGLVLFSGKLGDVFQDLKKDMLPHSAARVQAAGANGAVGHSTLSGTQVEAVLEGLPQGTLPGPAATATTGDSQDLQKTVATLGANGAVNTLADEIAKNARASLDAGKITPQEYDSLISLSNQGHELAEMMQLVDNAVLINPHPPITYQGRQYTIQEFAQKMGYMNPPADLEPLNTSQASGSVQAFLEAYDHLAQSGTLQHVDGDVGTLVSQIVTVHQTAAVTIDKVFYGKLPPEQLNSARTAEVTNSNSGEICGIAGGKDTGKKCSI